ncbi:MaoC family dehydratase N-terminal domain-containing protein [Phytohabitans sp. ZYX-F-186]|uniref:MaoC family dehydratase N-terminal domain-containing protein n=1 Tax=Phytohabitans maris TaxID=3071409 RepID=A0ABU0ZES5_9ACTN|nr:MaoC family dehydratase N-terminal domain-containing protein [Phytohabitans sp. ZYX-F-186]MDQ7905546.1 MaoC family dehydratase N-terminal domain-containing protein [Phytohabitans sp. ZYX-F-186]
MSDGLQWTEFTHSPPVTATDIRRWAIATYWPERPPALYVDEEYAATTRWAGIIAPRDFNPFAWLLTAPPAAKGAARSDFPHHPHVMNGGQADRYGAPIRPGDVISTRSRLAGVRSRVTRLGDTRLVSTEEEWVNQRHELVRLRTGTLLRYAS